MEEYRDLHLTAEAFMRTLDCAGLEQVGVAGVGQFDGVECMASGECDRQYFR